MPLKPHPTDPDKLLYVKAEYNLPPTKRTLAKIRQAAWDAVHKDYKDDPECCFVLGFNAGYDAVALRVEPPVSESGEGFESLPASPIAWISDNAGLYHAKPPESFNPLPLYLTLPQRKEWVGLTDDDLNALHYELKCAAMGATSTIGMYRILEKALKEKNT